LCWSHAYAIAESWTRSKQTGNDVYSTSSDVVTEVANLTSHSFKKVSPLDHPQWDSYTLCIWKATGHLKGSQGQYS
jgi:hypothetical protein